MPPRAPVPAHCALLDERIGRLEEAVENIPDVTMKKFNGSLDELKGTVTALATAKEVEAAYHQGFAEGKKPHWFIQNVVPAIFGTLLGIWFGSAPVVSSTVATLERLH